MLNNKIASFPATVFAGMLVLVSATLPATAKPTSLQISELNSPQTTQVDYKIARHDFYVRRGRYERRRWRRQGVYRRRYHRCRRRGYSHFFCRRYARRGFYQPAYSRPPRWF